MQANPSVPAFISEAINNQGFEITKATPLNEQRGHLRLSRDGGSFFAKYHQDSEQRTRLEVEMWWPEAVAALLQAHPDLPFNAPPVVDSGEGWFVREWVEGRSTAQPNDDPATLHPFIPSYAACLAALDQHNIQPSELPPKPEVTNATPFDRLDYRWEGWTEAPLQSGLLSPQDLQAARQILQDFAAHVTPRFQHGDLTPWHIVVDRSDNLWLIDGDHASFQKPRFYDLAYLYSRVFCNMHAPHQAGMILGAFLTKSGLARDEIYPAILPVLASRAIGLLFDAHNDQSFNDYRSKAQELLAICLSRDPARLLPTS